MTPVDLASRLMGCLFAGAFATSHAFMATTWSSCTRVLCTAGPLQPVRGIAGRSAPTSRFVVAGMPKPTRTPSARRHSD